jgi:hypothetical protein
MGLVLVLTLVLGLFGSGLWLNHAHATEAQPALHTINSVPASDIIPADGYINTDSTAPAILKYYLMADLNGTRYYFKNSGESASGFLSATDVASATKVAVAEGGATGTYRLAFWSPPSGTTTVPTHYMCLYAQSSKAMGRTRLNNTSATVLKDVTMNADGTFTMVVGGATRILACKLVGGTDGYMGFVDKATVDAAPETYAYVYLADACTAGTEAFDNGDGNHYYKCTSCDGKVGMTACTPGTELKHGDAAVETDDQANHWNTCTECGAVVASTKVAHNYGDWTNNGTEQTRTCGDCGYVQKAAVHTCEAAADAQWQTTDANQHYKLCKDCGQPVESTKADHEWTVSKIDGNAEKHAAKCACGAEKEVAHTFGDWTVVKAPATFSDKGTDKRTCADCGFEETKATSLAVEDVVKVTGAPTPGVPFYFGATQLQAENQPTYFFKGSWAPSKYQFMDRTTKIDQAAPMYSEAVSGGYKLYFYNAEGAKTYVIVAEMEVSGSTKVFVQPVTSAAEASVFTWNDEFDTFVTTVEGKGEYYIGNYTADGTAYTTLSALQVGGLGRDDRHPAHAYVAKGYLTAAQTGDNTMISVAVAAMVISLSAVAVLTVGKKKHI